MTSKFIKVSKEYFLNSSVHGLKYIAEEGRFLCERFLWLVLFIGGLLISMYFTDKLWEKWQMTPAYIGLNSTSTPISELFMPAITICSVFQQGDNFNRNRSQILKGFGDGTNVNETDRRSWRAWKNVARGLTTSDETFLVDSEPVVNEYVASHNMTAEQARFALLTIARLIGVSCGDILTSCSWRGMSLECLDLFSKQLTDDGFCCVMQELRDNDTKPLPHLHKNLRKKKKSNVNELLRPISAGIGSGLSVTLKKAPQPNPTLLHFASSSFVGYKVLVHSHEEYPEVHERGFAVPTQSETYVKINPLLVGTTEAASTLPVAKRRCYNNDERELRMFRQYSLPNCLVECSALYVMEKCHCCPFTYAKLNSTNFCDSISSLQCMKRALDEVRNNQTGLCGSCLITCKQIHFNVKVASVPSLTSINKIYFYFPDEAVTGYIRDVLYDWPGFISAAGGLLGLGFGFSLLSAAECVYFYTIRWAAEKL